MQKAPSEFGNIANTVLDMAGSITGMFPGVGTGISAGIKGVQGIAGNMMANGGDTSNEQSELTKFFGPSHAQGGINIGGGKEVEGGETMKDGFVHSDRIGYDKKGNPTFDEKATKITFADKAKKIDKLFIGRTDAISKKTKEMMYAKVENDNRKVGPIADAMNGSPSEEGKFWGGGPLIKEFNVTDGMDFNAPKSSFVKGKGYYYGNKDGQPIYGGAPGNPTLKNAVDPEFKYISKNPNFKTKGLDFTPQTSFNTKDQNTTLFGNNKINTTDNNNPTASNNNSTSESKIGFTPGDYANMASSLPAIGYNFAQGLKKAEQEKLQLNPNDPKVKQLMADRRINFQTLQNELTKERTKGAQDIGNNTRSVGSRNANLQSLYANSAAAKANMKLKEQQANIGYRGEEASMLNNLGQQERQAKVYQQLTQSQNDATKQNFIGQGFAEMGEGLKNTGNALNANSKNNMTVASVNALSQRYGIDPRIVNNLINQGYSGNALEQELVKYKG